MEIVPSLAAREKDLSAISMCAISTNTASFYQMEKKGTRTITEDDI